MHDSSEVLNEAELLAQAPGVGRVILLNGPPRCGKDTLAAMVQRRLGAQVCTIHKFAEPLKIGGAAALNIPLDVLEARYKESPLPGMEVTWRDYQISMSEEWYKPRFGKYIFGELQKWRILRDPRPVIVISDSGFTYEAKPLVDLFGVERCFVVKIDRPDHTYAGDSRDWFDETVYPGMLSLTLKNSSSPQNLLTMFEASMGLFNQRGENDATELDC